ncbi:hypothetical protein JB92DRAFT_3130939 [Gautieria morchelliformis]|nr:hypothetical protein JB92DRAFT_3130939 [Gautieria morchelliformis]
MSAHASPELFRVHAPRQDTNSSTSTTSTSSTSTSSTLTTTSTPSSISSSTTSATFVPSTTTTPTSTVSSSQSPSSSFSASSSFTSTQQSSSSSEVPISSSQSPQIFTPTSSFAINDTSSTGVSSQTRTTFTSTGSDGSLLTVTAVVSRPSGGSGSASVSTANQGFFANTGAVAGTFLVVGLVGTGILICAFLWALRRYRRRRRYQAYFDNEYKEFNQPSDRAATPDATLPVITRESTLDAPFLPSPAPNMIERLHGNDAVVPNVNFDPEQYRAQPGEFDPYQDHGAAYAYSDDQADYWQYSGSGQQGTIGYTYQPGMESTGTAGQYQGNAEPSHALQGAVDSGHSNHQSA